ncbi:MAG: hypothetical protein R3E96_14640, partial [Planctomycetota bacterium]
SLSPLPGGNLLLFDNQGEGGFTRLVEWDPVTQALGRVYRGTPPAAFVSIFSGNVHRLPNGNWLAAVSCAGYAREIDPGGQTVWEFHSPHRTGRQRELVAVLFDMQRLPADLDLSWTR